MKKIWMKVLVLAVGFAFTTTAMAQWGAGWGRRGFGPGNRWMGERYGQYGSWSDLTAEQVAKLNELEQTFLKDTANLRDELIQKRLELRNLLSQPEPDQGAVVAKQKEVNDLVSKLSEKEVAYQLETKKFLKPEQINQSPYGYIPGRGYGYCPGPGYGYGRGMGRGYGGFQGGPCHW